jgi:hypothetical protein
MNFSNRTLRDACCGEKLASAPEPDLRAQYLSRQFMADIGRASLAD